MGPEDHTTGTANTSHTTLEVTFQSTARVLWRKAELCPVTFRTATLPSPLLQHMGWLGGGSSTRTAAPPPRRCGRKEHRREAAPKDDKQASMCVFYTSPGTKFTSGPARLMRLRISGLGQRKCAALCAPRSDAQRVKEIRFLWATCVYTGAIQSHVSASRVGRDSTVQVCLASGFPPMQTAEQSKESSNKYISV